MNADPVLPTEGSQPEGAPAETAAGPPDDPHHVVVLLHGILLNRWFMAPLASRLRERGWRTLNLSYPSTRRTIEECATHVADRVAREAARTPITSVDLVTHSLGGLLGRRLITQGLVPAPRTLVQLVPPNRGSAVARAWRQRWLYRRIYGTGAGWQLGEPPEAIETICGIPEDIRWGIVMGVAGSTLHRKLLVSPHDGVVMQEEMRMPGRSLPTTTIATSHTPLQWTRRAAREVAHFLAHDRFLPDADPPPPDSAP